MIEKLNKWIAINSNGDWEHENMVKIQSSDIPGWNIHIDLRETLLEDIEYKYDEALENSFINISVENNLFTAFCSLNNFNRCLDIFFEDLLVNRSNKNFEYLAYLPFEYKNQTFYRKIVGALTNDLKFAVKSIPDIDVKELKASDFNAIVSTSYDQAFTKPKVSVGDVVDFRLVKLHDGNYPVIS